MNRIYIIIFGYMIGCIQIPYLVSKFIFCVDIKKQGSGNAGSTNVLRVLGKKIGIFVLVLDVSKVIIACYIANIIFDLEISNKTIAMYAGLGGVLGHNFPFYLGFKGGKGAATTLGLIFYINWIVGLSLFILGLMILKVKGYASISSMVSLTLSTVIFYLLGYNQEIIIISSILSILTVIQHRGNIKKLLNGTERKITDKRKKV